MWTRRLGWLVLIASACRTAPADESDTDDTDTETVDTEVTDTEVVDTEVVDTHTADTETLDTEVEPPAPECASALDCLLVDSCCDCLGWPEDLDAPECGLPECFVSTCTSVGIGSVEPTCEVGRCVLDVSCDPAEVTCRAAPPPCQPGFVPAVVAGCWASCIPVGECRAVPDCSVCDDADMACVRQGFELGPVAHCVAIPAACDGVADCACLGPSVCAEPFGLCLDRELDHLDCECPTC